jgi:UrcA family protein
MLTRHTFPLSFFCATLLLAPLGANAQTGAVSVRSADLNLTSDAGRAVLQQRIAHAVDRVCGSSHARTTADIQAYATCSKTARANAMAQYNAVVAKAAAEPKLAGAVPTSPVVN